MQFHTQFTHIFRHSIAEDNKNIGKFDLKMWSQICEKITKLVHKMTLKKVFFHVLILLALKEKNIYIFFKVIYWTN